MHRLLTIRSAFAVGVAVLAAAILASSAPVSPAPVGFEISAPADANRSAVRVAPPDPLPRRPQVFLAYHGSEGLLGRNDFRWPYVRENLDGMWGNWFVANPDTRTSLNRTIELTRKVRTRKLIVEHPIVEGGCIGFRDDFYETEVERLAPDIEFDRYAAAIYAGPNPDCWGPAGGIARAKDVYRRQGYDGVFTLFQPQNLSTAVNASAFPTIRPGSVADVAYRSSDGSVVECPIDACTDPTFGQPLIQAARDADARGVPFVWFTGYSTSYGIGRSGWLQRVQNTYNMLAFLGLWSPDDAIVVINYQGAYPALPERNANGSAADTTAGVLYWLLTQTPIPG